MKVSVFLSYPTPCFSSQEAFIRELSDFLINRGFSPRTIGVTDYDMDAPLKGIRRLMLECKGIITVAFRRTYIQQGISKFQTDLKNMKEVPFSDEWFSSPWSQIEAAMAYQIGLPILILRENGVIAEGILERGILGLYMPEFNLANGAGEYFKSLPWSDMIGRWEGYVRKVSDQKGNPPALF